MTRPIKKWAAAGALGVATFYLTISGSDVATQRSYVMLGVMLCAVMIDRRAITLRNVALAALIVLILEPGKPAQRELPDVVCRDARAGRGLRGARERADRRLEL